MAGDPWQTSYDAAERLHRSVLAEVGEAREVELLNDDNCSWQTAVGFLAAVLGTTSPVRG